MNSLLKTFIAKHGDPNLPLVAGVSGGADSLALLYGLHAIHAHVVVAHVDHAWREESQQEAEFVRKKTEELGFPFHLKRLDLSGVKGNLEDLSRHERYQFFQEVVSETGAQAIALAHHGDDQAETVLKQLLEGAFFPKGMSAVTQREGMPIWRPLLNLQKKELVSYLRSKKSHWIEDPTNEDPRFMRGRMRKKIIPELSEKFGKRVESPLCRFGERMHRIFDYLYEKVSPFLVLQKEDSTRYYDFTDLHLHDIEWEALVYFLMKKVGDPLSLPEREKMVHFLKEKKGVKKIGNYVVNRGKVIF